MTKFQVAVFVSILMATSLFAQNNRSAVSVTGSDAATCTVPDPCRTFDVAISKTASGGEIVVLSSGGYGPFTVTKSLSIISPGGIHAALVATAMAAIAVNGSGINVVLRNLWITGLGGAYGIHVLAAAKV